MPFDNAYLGKRLQDLLTLAHSQMKEVYEAHGLVIPVEGSSTLHAIAPGTSASLTEIAATLGQSHQLIAQRIGKLLALELAEKRADPNDGRRSEYILTPAGEEQWHRLDTLMQTIAKVNQRLFAEIGCDLVEGLDRALTALAKEDYQSRSGTVSTPTYKEEVQP
ncbi:MarR family winged helix-turn-helix transcriptional regulator [Aurantiacibacter sp. D1-12]|uniref:MarR family winged helix-turn-helix transcriptional regulator n=1 Tax=Aurantiacibacter sp. D1-12 TaxID=2993658 RepID=UPI00237C8C26|nr:MarR family transcriptional regulator [Aurantiacibacter sp. D1-12]MDE1468494.1 MarR family transcriptional regulator [Aurantiacibacter sp. D1-12]